jgi:hypothetical protein
MGMNKGGTAVAPAPVVGIAKVSNPAAESGLNAAVARLNTTKEEKAALVAKSAAPTNGYKPRDFDKETRGKVKCVMFEAALMSPAIAGLKYRNLEEYLVLVRQAAEAGVAYTFGE